MESFVSSGSNIFPLTFNDLFVAVKDFTCTGESLKSNYSLSVDLFQVEPNTLTLLPLSLTQFPVNHTEYDRSSSINFLLVEFDDAETASLLGTSMVGTAAWVKSSVLISFECRLACICVCIPVVVSLACMDESDTSAAVS